MATRALTWRELAVGRLAEHLRQDPPEFQLRVLRPIRELDARHAAEDRALRERWSAEEEAIDALVVEHEAFVRASERSTHTVFPGDRYRQDPSVLKRLYGRFLNYWTSPY